MEFCGSCHKKIPRGSKVEVHERSKPSPLETLDSGLLPLQAIGYRAVATTKQYATKIILGILILLGGGILYIGLKQSQSPMTHLWLYGSTLDLQPVTNGPLHYLVGLESDVNCWTMWDGRLDAPLQGSHQNEAGSVRVGAVPVSPGTIRVRTTVLEWTRYIRRSHEASYTTIPKNHPSVAPADALFDSQGRVMERQTHDLSRIGRAASAIFPHWPPHTHRPGSTWSEDVEWDEMMGLWKVTFRGTAHWLVKDYEPCADGACVHLTYLLELVPVAVHGPSWALRSTKPPEGRITGAGDVLYDTGHRVINSNLSNYEGDIIVPLEHLEKIPWEERPTDTVFHGTGSILLHLTDKLDVRKS